MPEGLYPEEGLRLLFLNDASLVNLIAARWFDSELPQGAAYPAVTLQKVSDVPDYNQRGQSGQWTARYQITIHADCHLKCMQVAAQVRRIIRQQPRGVFPGGIRYGQMQQMNEVVAGRERGRDVFQIAIDIRLVYQVES